MTTFTRTWNASYESSPADSQNASQGATRIREIKNDVSERLEVDHSWAGDTDDGAHKQITLVDPLASKPTQVNDETYIYSKDVSDTSELFYEDEAGNEVQLTNNGIIGQIFPIGAIYLSTSATNPAAVLGGTWTQISKGRTLLGEGTSDATYAAAATGGESTHVLTTAEMAAHTHGSGGSHSHGLPDYAAGIGSSSGFFSVTTGSTPTANTTDAGGAHTHTSVGSDDAHNNMPPYLVIYIWERTA